jgi:hypothetical protein
MNQQSIANAAAFAATVFTATAFATTAIAAELPTRKAGLWDMKMIFEGRNLPAQTMQHCVDAKTDKLMHSQFGGMSKEACSKQDMQVSGNTITMDSVCKFGAATSTSHAVITGSFDQAYTVKMTSTREGGPQMPGIAAGQPTNMTIEAKWIGPCKADQKPGDVVMANGIKMNVLEMPSIPGMRPQQPQR